MARVNLEEVWWTDPRRTALQRMGLDADGVAIRAWKLAQDFWKHGRAMVPKSLFDTLEGSEKMIQVGLADVRESFVYVRGSSAYLDWAFEKRQQAKEAGKKSADARREKYGTAQPQNDRTNTERPSNDARTESNDAEPSVSVSVSGSVSEKKEELRSIGPTAVAVADSEKKSVALKAKELAKAEANEKAKTFVAAYVKSFQTRFPASRPEDLQDGKVRGQILNWIASYGNLERACQLIQVYFQMETKWFGTKGYDFMTFRNNLNKIGQALDSGTDPDGNKIDFAAVYGEQGRC